MVTSDHAINHLRVVVERALKSLYISLLVLNRSFVKVFLVSARSLSKAIIKRGNEDSRLTEKAGEYRGIFKTGPIGES